MRELTSKKITMVSAAVPNFSFCRVLKLNTSVAAGQALSWISEIKKKYLNFS